MQALDTETCLFGPGNMAPPLVVVTLAGAIWAALHHRINPDWVTNVRLAMQDGGVVGHHIAYDMAVMAAEAPGILPDIFAAYASDKITDTMIREKLLDIRYGRYRSKSYSLASVAKARLGVELDKDTVRLRYSEMRDIPCAHWPEPFKQYAKDDGIVTYRVWQDQEKDSSVLADQYRQARAAFWNPTDVGLGITPDQERVAQLREQIAAKQQVSIEILLRAGLLREQGGKLVRNTKAAKALIIQAYARKGEDHPLTDTGEPELSREACQGSGEPAARCVRGLLATE
jgi:hypothetical protein